jgi:hypothetical protein
MGRLTRTTSDEDKSRAGVGNACGLSEDSSIRTSICDTLVNADEFARWRCRSDWPIDKRLV